MANTGTQLDPDELTAAVRLVSGLLAKEGKGGAGRLAKRYRLSSETVRKAGEGSIGRTALESILKVEGLSRRQLLEKCGVPAEPANGEQRDPFSELAALVEMPTDALRMSKRVGNVATALPIELKRAAVAASQLYDCSLEQAAIAASAAYRDLGPKVEWMAEHWLGPIKERINQDKSSGTRPSVRNLKIKE